MAGKLVPIGDHGGMVPQSPTEELNRAVLANYHTRGDRAAQLVVAALTESAYVPPFGIEIPELPVATGREPWDFEDEYAHFPGEAEIDSSALAIHTLQEYLRADAPGADKLRLGSYKTRYKHIWRALRPGRRSTAAQVGAFQESMMTSLEQSSCGLQSPDQVLTIITGAPSRIKGLRLTDARRHGGETRHDMITDAGRIVRVRGKVDYHNIAKYWLPYRFDQLSERSGTAPGPDIQDLIKRRVLNLRAASSKR